VLKIPPATNTGLAQASFLSLSPSPKTLAVM